MINSQATRNLFGHSDLGSWVPGGATGKKFLNHRLISSCQGDIKTSRYYCHFLTGTKFDKQISTTNGKFYN